MCSLPTAHAQMFETILSNRLVVHAIRELQRQEAARVRRREEEKKKAEKRGGDASQAGPPKQKEDGVKLSDLQVYA